MKRKATLAVTTLVLLLGGLWYFRVHRDASLPRFPLTANADGSSPSGEFRIVKICYGGEDDQRIGGASAWRFRLWRRLPESLKRVIPYPEGGVQGEYVGPPHTAISIWWEIVDPVTHQSEGGNPDEVTMTLDNGEDWNLSYCNPGDPADQDGTIRFLSQIMVVDPPKDSRKLHFAVPIEDQMVEFTIANPAYGR